MSLIERTTELLLGERIDPPDTIPRQALPEDVVIRAGRLVPRIGGLLGRFGSPAAAVALRRTIVVNPSVELTPGLLAHELEHVKQWREDVLFPLRYALATLRHGYRNNPYEVAARVAAAAASDERPSERAT